MSRTTWQMCRCALWVNAAQIQETKLIVIFLRKKTSINSAARDRRSHSQKIHDLLAASSQLCNRQSLTLLIQRSVTTVLTTTLACIAAPNTLKITIVYAPTDQSLKPDFLAKINNLNANRQDPWMIIEVFNLLYFALDKNNRNFRQTKATMFNDCIDNLGLIKIARLDYWLFCIVTVTKLTMTRCKN